MTYVVESDGIVRRKRAHGSGRKRKWAWRMGNVHSLIMSALLSLFDSSKSSVTTGIIPFLPQETVTIDHHMLH